MSRKIHRKIQYSDKNLTANAIKFQDSANKIADKLEEKASEANPILVHIYTATASDFRETGDLLLPLAISADSVKDLGSLGSGDRTGNIVLSPGLGDQTLSITYNNKSISGDNPWSLKVNADTGGGFKITEISIMLNINLDK